MKLLWFPISWFLFCILKTICIMLGWIMVPLAIKLDQHNHWRNSKIFPERYIRAFKSKIFWLWGNEEEGIGHYGEGSIDKKVFYSEVIRNPANNLRYVPYLNCMIDPDKVKWIGSFGSHDDILKPSVIEQYDDDNYNFWSLTWCGLYSNIRFHFPLRGSKYRFWIGWKIYPEDVFGVKGQRKMGAGFAMQLKRIG